MRFKRRKPQSIKRSTPKRVSMPRFRRARRAARTIYRTARKSYRRSSSKGFGGGKIMNDVEGALGKGMLYQGIAQKFVPSLAPIAGLYGGWKGGGLTGLAVTELFVKPFIGLPSNLGNLTGLLGNLGLGGQSQQTGMTGAV